MAGVLLESKFIVNIWCILQLLEHKRFVFIKNKYLFTASLTSVGRNLHEEE